MFEKSINYFLLLVLYLWKSSKNSRIKYINIINTKEKVQKKLYLYFCLGGWCKDFCWEGLTPVAWYGRCRLAGNVMWNPTADCEEMDTYYEKARKVSIDSRIHRPQWLVITFYNAPAQKCLRRFWGVVVHRVLWYMVHLIVPVCHRSRWRVVIENFLSIVIQWSQMLRPKESRPLKSLQSIELGSRIVKPRKRTHPFFTFWCPNSPIFHPFSGVCAL